jgi:hypothetical protein
VVQALHKLKGKSDVIVRVNFQDLNMTTEHKKEIIEMAERVRNMTIAEDSSVDPGGAIIETDFGQIDARISSQLREIEDRIIELTPIKSSRSQNRNSGLFESGGSREGARSEPAEPAGATGSGSSQGSGAGQADGGQGQGYPSAAESARAAQSQRSETDQSADRQSKGSDTRSDGG